MIGRWLLRLGLGLVAVLGLLFGGFYLWSQNIYEASNETLLEMLDGKTYRQRSGGDIIASPEYPPKAGIILYPGAKVEPEAYAYYATKLAEQGYYVVVPNMRFNFALLDVDRAYPIMAANSHISKWFIGGHSLGGVAAAMYAYEHPGDHMGEVSGLIFLASYPARSNDFSPTELPILSIYGELDGLTTINKIEDAQGLLSSNTTLHQIEGGNHAQFGVYGRQKGDLPAAISVKAQQDELVDVTLDWLNRVNQ